MLMAARSLLENSGSELTSASDAFTVARKVLISHDVAELVLAALCIENGNGHKLTERTSFSMLAKLVVESYAGQDDQAILIQRQGALDALNHARVRFKHHGDLLDAATTYPVVEQAFEIVDLLCQRAVGLPLRSIDALASVTHEAIVENFRVAENQIVSGQYRDALASLARVVSIAFWDFDVRGVRAGEPTSEAALVLSGRGIDPASFLEMQRLLPELYSRFDDEPKFDTRLYGHEANWTMENVQFCWDTALTLVLRLQHARPVPQAKEFYDEFEDLITVSADTSVCFRVEGSRFSDEDLIPTPFGCHRGESFTGKASGFYERRAPKELEFALPLSEANWIRLENHSLRQDVGASMLFSVDELWFDATTITITYQENAWARTLRQYRNEQSGTVPDSE